MAPGTSKSQELDRIFQAMADTTRRDILDRLAREPVSIGALSESYDMSLAAVSKHVKVLERAGLVTTTKSGRVHRCTLNPERLDLVAAEIERYRQFWDNQLAALDDYVNSLNKERSK